MGHDHDHGETAGHGRAFLFATVLNLGFVVLGAVFGVLAHSMALVADAGHNLGDVLGLVLAWGATVLARRKPTPRHTFGLRRTSILAALLNALLLLVATGGIVWEAIRHLFEPQHVASTTVIVLSPGS